MVVDEVVAATLRSRSWAQVATFVAGCAERMAQVFTGLNGDDPDRSDDVDLVIRLVDDLWDPAVPAASFREHLDSLESFPEFEPSDKEISDVAGIYSFYSVLVLQYATFHRVGSDVENALKCAHVCLTAMGQLDQNIPDAGFFDQEAELQRNAASTTSGDQVGDSPVRLRDDDRAVSQERLAVIRGRLSGRAGR